MISSGFRKCFNALPLRRYPIHAALADNDLILLGRRLRHGHRINKRDMLKRTPLHFAVSCMRDPSLRYEACSMLLDEGADVNIEDDLGRTPLQYLADRRIGGEVKDGGKLINLLISRGAKTAQCSTGKCVFLSPLYTAVSSDNLIAAEKLLQSEATIDYARSICTNFLRMAISNGSEDMFKLLLKHKAELNNFEVIREASSIGKIEFLQCIVDYSDELNEKNIVFDLGQSTSQAFGRFLFDTVSVNSFEALELLLENGVDMYSYLVDVPSRDVFCLLSHVYFKYRWYANSMFFERYRSGLLKVLKHTAILMETDSTKIKKETLNFIENNDFITEKLKIYKEQVILMKKNFVNENFNFTYFDFLTRKGILLWNCCSDEIVSGVSEDIIEKLFPDFVDKLMRIIRKVTIQKSARDNFEQMLYNIMRPKLPFELICNICDFITMKDLLLFRLCNITE